MLTAQEKNVAIFDAIINTIENDKLRNITDLIYKRYATTTEAFSVFGKSLIQSKTYGLNVLKESLNNLSSTEFRNYFKQFILKSKEMA